MSEFVGVDGKFGDAEMDALRKNAPDLFGGVSTASFSIEEADLDAALPEIMGLDAVGNIDPWYLSKLNPWVPLIHWWKPFPMMPTSVIPAANEWTQWSTAMTRQHRQVIRYAKITAVHTLFVRPVGAALGALHGYARSGKRVSHAVLWGAFGLVFPLITAGTAIYQGFARPQIT